MGSDANDFNFALLTLARMRHPAFCSTLTKENKTKPKEKKKKRKENQMILCPRNDTMYNETCLIIDLACPFSVASQLS
jgi:hypothetical protein